jgi:hypothetical protein
MSQAYMMRAAEMGSAARAPRGVDVTKLGDWAPIARAARTPWPGWVIMVSAGKFTTSEWVNQAGLASWNMFKRVDVYGIVFRRILT